MQFKIVFLAFISLPLLASQQSPLSEEPRPAFAAYLQQCRDKGQPQLEKLKTENPLAVAAFEEKKAKLPSDEAAGLFDVFMTHLGEAHDRPESRARVVHQMTEYMNKRD